MADPTQEDLDRVEEKLIRARFEKSVERIDRQRFAEVVNRVSVTKWWAGVAITKDWDTDLPMLDLLVDAHDRQSRARTIFRFLSPRGRKLLMRDEVSKPLSIPLPWVLVDAVTGEFQHESEVAA
jgi:hypothetical protein